MKIEVLTLFPDMFAPLRESILGRAQEKGQVQFAIHQLREFTEDRHRTVDDTPYGGGPGMLLMAEPFEKAFHALLSTPRPTVVYMTPQGEPFSQKLAQELSQLEHLFIVCGHYEGLDERIRQTYVDREVSIGDYVLTGGELPAMVVIDATVRLLPDVLGEEASHEQDSFSNGLLEHPHYTRPRVFLGQEVPPVLLSGDHKAIEVWRRQQSLIRTYQRRPELLEKARLTQEDWAFLHKWLGENEL